MSLKDDYLSQMKSHVANWDKEIDQLTAKMQSMSEEAKSKGQEHLAALQVHRDAAMAKLAEMGNSSEAAMEEMKKGVEGAWASMKDAMEKAYSAFKK